MQKQNNLSDLENIVAARSHLGLGNSATQNIGFGTNEVAPGDNVPECDGTRAFGSWHIDVDTVGGYPAGLAPNHVMPLDADAKTPYQADKIIISDKDPDPAQGKDYWLWFNVSDKGPSDNPTISWVSHSGYNCLGMIINDNLYTASGDAGAMENGIVGRGTNDQTAIWGAANPKRVNFPYETQPPIEYGTYSWRVAFALFANGNLYVWGQNNLGQCGLGNNNVIPVPTLTDTNVAHVYNDSSQQEYNNDCRMMIRKKDGTFWGCGYNGRGGLGLGTVADNVNTWQQIPIPGNGQVLSFWNYGSTFGSTFIQTTDMRLYACGCGNSGQLGNRSQTDANPNWIDITDDWVPNGETVHEIGGGAGFSDTGGNGSCYILMWLKHNGADIIKTAGNNTWGSVGTGTMGGIVSTPIQPNIGDLSMGIKQICTSGGCTGVVKILKNDGELWTWGYNDWGGLGNGNATSTSTPFLTTSDVDELYFHKNSGHFYGYRLPSFIKKKDGYLYGCGKNDQGDLGIGNRTNPITSWVRPLLPSDGKIKFLGNFQYNGAQWVYVAVMTDDRVYMWGGGGNHCITGTVVDRLSVYPMQFDMPRGG